MSMDPSDPGVDLCIGQLCGKGTVRTTWPRIQPHGHFSLMEQLELAAKKGPHPSALLTVTAEQSHTGVVAYRDPSGAHRTPSWVGGGAATRENGEWRIGVVPQKESYFPPPVRRIRYREVEVWINSAPRSNEDVHTTQSCHFLARALL
jgi:hypothetical protein